VVDCAVEDRDRETWNSKVKGGEVEADDDGRGQGGEPVTV
jgi:hypothetical protein